MPQKYSLEEIEELIEHARELLQKPFQNIILPAGYAVVASAMLLFNQEIDRIRKQST